MEVGSRGCWFWEGLDGIPGEAATQTGNTWCEGHLCQSHLSLHALCVSWRQIWGSEVFEILGCSYGRNFKLYEAT